MTALARERALFIARRHAVITWKLLPNFGNIGKPFREEV